MLANAASGLLWARASDIWGRKPPLILAVLVFTGASILAARSQSMRVLLAARTLQGVGSGGLSQLVVITISDLFSMRRRTLFLGLMGAIWAVAGSCGPLLGGVFTQLLSWRWCFWINVPFCVLALGFLVAFLEVHNPRTPLLEGLASIDWAGYAASLAHTFLVYACMAGLAFGASGFAKQAPLREGHVER